MGDRMGPPPTLRLVPRERTQFSLGAASSSGPVRLTLGPCASLPPDLTEDPKVARIVCSTYKGHVIMYTNTNIMPIQESGHIPITALPDFDLQPGKPSDECLSIKLPRTNLDHQDLLDQRRLAINKGETLTVEGSCLWGTALLLEGCYSENEYHVD